MGISGFNGNVMSSGLLPILIINTVLTMAAIKQTFTHLLQVLGLVSAEEQPPPRSHAAENDTDTINTIDNNDNRSRDDGDMGRGLGAGLARLLLVAEDIQNNPPVTYLRSGGSAAEEDDCAVCLSEFEEGDEIRKLPCCHWFHRICLEKWLHDRAMTCPLCRASLVPEDRMKRLAQEEQELTEDLLHWFSSCNDFHG